jgi:Asp-tRNA(Asn)/Glu-tRNA(Gln) amidotransferase A subunit family amidase
MIHDYWRYEGLAQAELVRAGEVTARELVESAIEASARLNPVLNVICHDLADRARAVAGKPASDLDTFWEKFSGDAYSPFAGIFNVTGQPAALIPCLVTDDRRPVGVQIVARFGDEATLFGLSTQIEEARPWRDQLPPVHVSNTTAAGPFASAASPRSRS